MKPTHFLTILVVSAMLFNLRPSCADVLFPEAYQAAKKLPPDQREAEFVRIADMPGRVGCKDAAFAAAAAAAVRMKRFEAAEEHAGRIKDENQRNVARMSILEQQRKWDDLLEMSRDFELTGYPDALISPAALMRGTASAHMGERTAADRDFDLAVSSLAPPARKLETMFSVATLYGTILKDTGKEFEILSTILRREESLAHLYRQKIHCRHAVLLAEKGKVEEAIRTLEAYPVDKAASRRFEVNYTLGNLYRRKGDIAKARSHFETAVAVEDLPANYQQRAQEGIKSLDN